MRWSSIVSLLAVLATTAAVVPSTHGVHEQRDVHPPRWAKLDRVRPEAILPVRVALAQNNIDNGYEYLMDVSHPASPNYGKHWTADEVIDAFRPSDADVEAVLSWLVESGIPLETITHSDNKAWLAFHAPTSKVEELLHTEYHEYQDRRTGGVMPACHAYHVPKDIQHLIDYITPGIKLLAPTDELTELGRQSLAKRGTPHAPSPRSGKKLRPSPAGYSLSAKGSNDQPDLSTCDQVITPACIAALYQIPPAPKYADPSNSMGIYEAQQQYWDQYDLDLFFTNFTQWIPNGTHPIEIGVDGGVGKTKDPSKAGTEAVLDIMAAYPIVYPQTLTVWDVDDLNYQGWLNDSYIWGFNTLLDAIDGSYCTYSAYGETGNLDDWDPSYPDPAPNGYNGPLQCGVFKPTNVFSFSYGGQEADLPIAYQKRQCDEFLKLGLQGVSFIFASGDSGIGNYPDILDGPTGCLGPDLNIFNPTWPNSCPYVTNVGGTKVYPGKTVFEPESALYDPAGDPFQYNFTTGGGFSNIYPIPDYQKSAVATYFADHDPGLPYYSSLAQVDPNDVYALPNVTLLAGNTGGVYNRIGRGIPDVAAVSDNIAVSLGGEFGLAAGTSASTPIFAGIINRINEERLAVGKGPLGFLNPSLYANPDMFNDITNGTNKACIGQGFNATKGWDPLTGLGTPNYPKMLDYFMSLP